MLKLFPIVALIVILSNSAMATNVDSLIIKESDSDMVLSKLSHLEQEIYEHRLREAYYTDVIGTNVSYCCAIIGLLGLTVGGIAFFNLSKTKSDCIRATEEKIKEYSDSQEEFKTTALQASKAAYYAAYTVNGRWVVDQLKVNPNNLENKVVWEYLNYYWDGLNAGVTYAYIQLKYEKKSDNEWILVLSKSFSCFEEYCRTYKVDGSFAKRSIEKSINIIKEARFVGNTTLTKAIEDNLANMEEIIQLEDSSSEVSSK